MTTKKETGIQKIIDAYGSQREVAKLVGVTQQAVQYWVQCGYVPYKRIHDIAKMFKVEPESLRRPI